MRLNYTNFADDLSAELSGVVTHQAHLLRRSGVTCEIQDPPCERDWDRLYAVYQERAVVCLAPDFYQTSIWRDAAVYYDFRFWHDAIHYRNNWDFGDEGEIETALAHRRAVFTQTRSHDLGLVIYFNSLGLNRVLRYTGGSPGDDRQFIKTALGEGLDSAVTKAIREIVCQGESQ